MEAGADELPAQDVGTERVAGAPPKLPAAAGAPSWQALTAVGLAIVALLGVYALGRSGAPAPLAAPVEPVATLVPPTAIPAATATPEPDPPPEFEDLLGQGFVLAEFELGNRSRALIWCRESVPGTQISSTLALIHVASSIRFGDQVVLYEELTKPSVPGGSARRGRVLETEGLGAGNFSATAPLDDGADLDEIPDGARCASCAPDQVTFGGGDMLVGSCVHGVPFGVGIVYVIASPVRAGQTPLALHVSCGITTVRIESDRLVIEGEAPLLRGLHEARFPLPAISFERTDGRFVASDLELLDWNCEIERSSHLADKHLLRTEPGRSISYEPIDSAIGQIGVHGQMVLGLTTEQCSMLTRAWWGQPDLGDSTGSPIADLVGLDPPASVRDWFYGCHLS